ncbi:PadR family transcriptional regulator [Actinomadura geliboluensis]|uniref:PadR family transcriptional regulator n=1 Tax=Actinomadura geliboluensis TaxID=882440 RepID=UPI0036A764CA
MPRNIPQQWLHGFLDVCLLCLLADRRDYGRGLVERLADVGFDEVPGGTLYPALLRLEKQGLVRTEKEVSPAGPPRKYYELTDLGRAAMHERRSAWMQFRTAMSAVVETPTGTHAPSGSM